MANIPEHILDLIIDDFSQRLSAEDAKVLKDWIEESPENKMTWDEVFNIWQTGSIAGLKKQKASDAWNKISTQAKKQKKLQINWKAISVAASILVLIGSSLFIWQNFESTDEKWAKLNELAKVNESVKLVLQSGQEIELNDTANTYVKLEGKSVRTNQGSVSYKDDEELDVTEEVVYHELIIPKGGRYELTLADGTLVILNSESKIKFPSHFQGNTREVWMSGEAYFDVEHNAAKPFVVHSKGFDTRVLGTEFNVKAYSDESSEEVTLVEGSVEVKSEINKALLKPGYQIQTEVGSEIISKPRKVDTYIYTAWKEGVLYFDDIKLSDLLNNLNRWYNFSFEFKDEALKEKLYTGGIKKNDDLQKVFTMIEKVNDVEFNVKKNHIVISNK